MIKLSRKNGFHHAHRMANTALAAYRLAHTCIPESKGICENPTPSNSTRASQKGRVTYHIIHSTWYSSCSSASAEALPEMSCSVGFFHLQTLVYHFRVPVLFLAPWPHGPSGFPKGPQAPYALAPLLELPGGVGRSAEPSQLYILEIWSEFVIEEPKWG